MKRLLKRDQPSTHKHMVKKRHSQAYHEANTQLIKQVSQQNTNLPACSCGNNIAFGVGGYGRIELFCSSCNTLLYVKDMRYERLGDQMTPLQKQYLRDGYCEFCGHELFTGKLYVTSKRKYVYQYFCQKCDHNYVLIDKNAVHQKKYKHMDKVKVENDR